MSVLIPMAGECPQRRAALRCVVGWYAARHPGYEVVVGEGGEGPWCKAEGVAAAAEKASGDVFVVSDGDCLVPGVALAVGAVAAGSGWAVPHYVVHRLSRDATDLVLGGADPASLPGEGRWRAERPYVGVLGGGVVVLPAETYRRCPLDPVFRGWGQEDQAWAHALRVVAGVPWRSASAPLWHLWHPPQRRMSRSVGSEASRSALRKYLAVRERREMETLLVRAREFYAEASRKR